MSVAKQCREILDKTLEEKVNRRAHNIMEQCKTEAKKGINCFREEVDPQFAAEIQKVLENEGFQINATHIESSRNEDPYVSLTIYW